MPDVRINQKDLEAFLGLLTYYFHHIEDFSSIANPPVRATRCPTGYVKCTVSSSKDKGFPTLLETDVNWTIEDQEAKELLISRLVNPSVLAYPGLQLLFQVHTDA